MSVELRLSELLPGAESPLWAEVVGYQISNPQEQSMKTQLMAFGILPGVKTFCESRLPFSQSRVYQFGSWRGVLREDEAALIRVRLIGEAL